jgi:hypothetical protein
VPHPQATEARQRFVRAVDQSQEGEGMSDLKIMKWFGGRNCNRIDLIAMAVLITFTKDGEIALGVALWFMIIVVSAFVELRLERLEKEGQ